MEIEQEDQKKRLRIALFANEELFCESSDPALWQAVFSAIYGISAMPAPQSLAAPQSISGNQPVTQGFSGGSAPSRANPSGAPGLEGFASELGVEVAVLQGACDPTETEPFLQLDHDSWESFKTQLGDRGKHAVSPIVVAVTLLGLWLKQLGLGSASIAQAQKVLATIGVRDANAGRGISRADWLQSRPGGQVIIHPAKGSRARLFAACFCNNDWTPWKNNH
jgi:hypothetical protein